MDSESSFISRIFGTFRWSAPGWMRRSAEALFTAMLLFLIASLRMLAEKPVRFINCCLIIAALTIGGFYGYSWYKNLPQPQLVTFTFKELLPREPAADSRPQNLNLQFSHPAAALKLIGKTVNVRLEPHFNGKWKWLDDRNLVFEPDSEWPVGQKYSVTLDKALFNSRIAVEKYDFNFNSPLFKLLSQSSELYQDPTDPKIRQAVLKLKLSHTTDKTDLERKTSVLIKKKSQQSFSSKLGFKLTFDETTNEAFIRSDSLEIPDVDSEVQIKVASGLKPAAGGAGLENEILSNISIPGVENYFKISEVTEDIVTNSETHEAERIISISTTAGIKSEQLIRNTEVLLLPHNKELYSKGAALPSETDEYDDNYGEEEYIDPDSCPWTDIAQIPQEALIQATAQTPKWIAGYQESATFSSFKTDAEAGRCLLIRFKKGMNSFAGIPLAEDRNFVIRTKEFPKEVFFTDKGAILSLNGERKINVLSRGIQGIKFKLYRVLPNSLQHLSQFGFNYPYSFSTPSFDYNFGPENISEVYESKISVPDFQAGKTAYSLFDFGRYLDSYPQNQRGLFILKASGIDPQTGAAQTTEDVSKLVLVSNLGFLVKQNQDKTGSIFVMSTATQQPVDAAKVEVLGKNGLPVFSTQTDINGVARIDRLDGFINEKTPVTYVVSHGNDLSFMPYSLADRSLNFSSYDIGGLYSVEDEKSLQAYLFSDRGIYRPGESARIGLIVKKLDWSGLPQNLPLELVVQDPRELEIVRKKIQFSDEGFSEFNFDISEGAITGGYTASLQIIGKNKRQTTLGQTAIRVEEFLPDRLKIDAKWSENIKGWYKPEQLKADLTLRNLYGNAAEGHKLKAQIKLRANSLSFKEFSSYNFFDPFNPYRQNSSFDEDLGELISDSDGKASFDLGLNRFESATYSLAAVFQGFEKDGGRSVATTLSAIVSPADYITGWKADSDLSFIKKNFRPVVNIIALNPEAQKTTVNNLKLELYESKYLSVLTRQNSGNLAYQSVLKENLIETKDFFIPTSGYNLIIEPKNPGNYFYKIKSSDGKELNTIRFKVVGAADLSGSLEKNAQLDIKLDRSDYPSESEIQVSITGPYKGSGLITIERDNVYASKWFKADSNSSIQTISIPKGLEGNAYINVALVRSLDSRDIFASPLSYATIPFSISRESRNEKLSLKVPDIMQPGQNLTITASSPEKTRAVIFAVDEGILQVARYKKPEPVSHFFRKRALEVSTKQILDMLLPEFSILKELSGAGGDEDALLGKHRNPFKRKGQKPLIYWSGLTDLDSNPKEFSFAVPDYFSGSVKSFIVSVSDSKIGTVEATTEIKADLVLSPNAPLFAAPGDQFITSVTVANTTTDNRLVKVGIKTDLETLSGTAQEYEIPAGKDKLVEFNLKALNKLGSSSIVYTAEAEGLKKSSYTLDLSVRPATPKLESVKLGVLGGSADSTVVESDRILFNEFSERSFAFSSLPLSLSYSLSKYLESFPHACSEQLSSQGIGHLILSDSSADKTLQKTFSTLAARQTENGAFSVWAGSSYSADWVNIHTARFIIESRQAGKDLNSYLLSNTERYLREFVNNSAASNLEQARLKAYAIYLLTRSGVTTTNYLQTLTEDLNQVKGWKKDITGLFMAGSYKLLMMDKQADGLLDSYDFSVLKQKKQSGGFNLFSPLSIYGLSLDIISRHFSSSVSKFNPADFEVLSLKLAGERFNTSEAANLIIGLNSYSKLSISAETSSAKLEGSKDGSQFSELPYSSGKTATASLSTDIKKVRITRPDSKALFYQLFESGFDMPDSKIPEGYGLEVHREFLDSKGTASTTFNLGDDITAVIRIRNTTDASTLEDLALIDIHPSGLELSDGLNGMKSQFNDYWYNKFTDATEDRLLFYGDLYQGAAEIRYKIKAVARGKFTLPALQAEAMYDPRISARTTSGTIEIR